MSLMKDSNVELIKINNDTFNLMTKSAFLDFFMSIKNLSDKNKELLRLFLTEENGYTDLNMEIIETGIQAHLGYFLKAHRLHENIPEINENKILISIRDDKH